MVHASFVDVFRLADTLQPFFLNMHRHFYRAIFGFYPLLAVAKSANVSLKTAQAIIEEVQESISGFNALVAS